MLQKNKPYNRKQLNHDLFILLDDMRNRIPKTEEEMYDNLKELTNRQLDKLVDEAAHLHEWLGLA
jgi:hypothetical protein